MASEKLSSFLHKIGISGIKELFQIKKFGYLLWTDQLTNTFIQSVSDFISKTPTKEPILIPV